MAKGVTITLLLNSLENTFEALSRINYIISMGLLGESARIIPDIDKQMVFLELRDISPESREVKRLLEEFRSWEMGEVKVQAFVVPRSVASVASVQEQALHTIAEFEGTPSELEKQLKELSDPKYWILDEVSRLQYRIDALNSEVIALKVRYEEKEKAAEQRQTVRLHREQKFYEKANFWVEVGGVVIAIIALYLALRASGYVP